MALQLIVDANGNKGWQARMHPRGPGNTAYFSIKAHGARGAKAKALQALAAMARRAKKRRAK
ncbi:MAG: hypothetical protein KF788_08660 [Piscinibacter sp.]|nr:hypothetical protein [Piscinibacter sp.]